MDDTAEVELTAEQLRYMTAFVWVRLDEDPGDKLARQLFEQFKAATIRMGDVWTYGSLPRLRPTPWRRRGARLPGGTWVREGNS